MHKYFKLKNLLFNYEISIKIYLFLIIFCLFQRLLKQLATLRQLLFFIIDQHLSHQRLRQPGLLKLNHHCLHNQDSILSEFLFFLITIYLTLHLHVLTPPLPVFIRISAFLFIIQVLIYIIYLFCLHLFINYFIFFN